MSFTEEALGLLTKGARAAIPFFRAAVEAAPGATSEDIIGAVRELGASVRRTDALAIIRQLKGNLLQRPAFTSVPLNLLPSARSLGRALTRTSQNYSFIVRITGIHPETDERIRRNVTVTSNKILSKQQVLDIAEGFVGAEGASAGLEEAQMQVTEGLISQGFNP